MMTEVNYRAFARDCPDRIIVLIRGKQGKVIDVCGQTLPELVSETNSKDCEWIAPADGLYVFDVSIEHSKTWTDYGYEYDSDWEPHSMELISDEMWNHFVLDEHIWPDSYYASEVDV